MNKVSLNGLWNMKKSGTDIIYNANVPTTMYEVLFENKVIDDPFVGENDVLLTGLSDDDYEFERTFDLDCSILENDVVNLVFYGLDTLATVWLNDAKILKADNMHKTYELDVKSLLKEKDNTLKILFASPTTYIKNMQALDPLWGVDNPMDGYEYMRKAHHMFGWDWGPQLPDMGIWRDVEIQAYSKGKLEDFYLVQNHGENKADISLSVDCNLFGNDDLEIAVEFTDNHENVVYQGRIKANQSNELEFTLHNPELWWPNGYGPQNLYQLTIQLISTEDQTVIDSITKKIGLRTLTMIREKDQWGESFDMTVNGVRIFAMGADYIPEDVLITRMNQVRTRQLLEDCVDSNFNHIRVWGGAFYPEDYFYDLCDELGLIVWQDFMFACGIYKLTKEFEENVIAEITQNVKRIRHHASLGLWCGNNEMEMAFVDWDMPKTLKLKNDYLKMYEYMIPSILEQCDPNTFYWPASPSSGGGFEDPNSPNKGDVHYWEVFHGDKHYKEVRKHYFRFASEFGMQSFPDLKTIQEFANEEEQVLSSSVMDNHNKCWGEINGNIKIMLNMATEYQMPNNLEDMVYLSQVFQGEAIRCAVEHMRSNRGRCMGSTYWQLNDNWPVASWSSIDVNGRWKALQYMVKRFYAPVYAASIEDGLKAYIHVCNEKMSDFKGVLHWQVRHVEGSIAIEDQKAVAIEKLTASKQVELDISSCCKKPFDERNYYLSYQLYDENGTLVSSEIMFFVKQKYFNYKHTDLNFEIKKNGADIEIHVKASEMAKNVEISFDTLNLILSDNYFDMLPNETKIVTIKSVRENPINMKEAKEVKVNELCLEKLKEEVTLKAVNSLSYIC